MAVSDLEDNTDMDYMAFVAEVERDGQLLGKAAAGTDWYAPVPSCPEWTMRDVVRHMAQVHRWAGTHVLEPRTDDDVELLEPPADDALLDWYAEGHARLVDALRAAGPDGDAWFFLPAPSGAAFWARRQAHETAIHRVDAELSAGVPVSPFDPEFGADGVDEVLSSFYARRPTRLISPVPYSFGLRATDVDRGWRTVVGPDGPVTTDLTEPVDVLVTASAADLYLLMWSRVDHRDLALSGDPRPLEHWRDNANIVWG